MERRRRAAASFIVLYYLMKRKRNRKRPVKRQWMSNICAARSDDSFVNSLGEEEFHKFMFMSREDFDFLAKAVGPSIEKANTPFRKPVSVEDRLAVTLRLLMTGDTFKVLRDVFRISRQTISNSVSKTSAVLVEVLKSYIKLPDTTEEWLQISEAFEKAYGIPHCLGVVGGRSIILPAPYNHLSILLFALVDDQSNFRFLDVRIQDGLVDGTVFYHTMLYDRIADSTLNLPPEFPLPGGDTPVPYVFLSGDSLLLTDNVMTPFGECEDCLVKRIFNNRICAAQKTIENLFEIVPNIFRILKKPIRFEPEKVQNFVMAIICLHNYLRNNSISSEDIYPSSGPWINGDSPGNPVDGTLQQEFEEQPVTMVPFINVGVKSEPSAVEIRDHLAQYLYLNNETKIDAT